jgi:hypothetical protein
MSVRPPRDCAASHALFDLSAHARHLVIRELGEELERGGGPEPDLEAKESEYYCAIEPHSRRTFCEHRSFRRFSSEHSNWT